MGRLRNEKDLERCPGRALVLQTHSWVCPVPDTGCVTWGKAHLQAEPQLLYLESGVP